MYQRIELIGRLGHDPSLRYTPSGVPVCNFSVAVDNQRKPKDGEAKPEAQWFNIIAWQKTAEACNEYLAKGALVFVSGQLQVRDYEKRDGTAGYAVEVNAREVKFLQTRKHEDGDAPRSAESPEEKSEIVDEDIPF